MSVYTQEEDEKGAENQLVKAIGKDSELTLKELEDKQHFTQPPAHFTEAALVKTLEELGIGRPSTYAPTISTIIARRYVAKEGRNLYLTELGEVVNNMMKKSFPSIVEADFTANMESLLDMVEEGKVGWKTVVSNFYPDLEEAVEIAEKELEEVKIEDEVTDVICEESRGRAGEGEDRGRGHRRGVRAVRPQYGGQVRAPRQVPGLPRFPGLPEHQAIPGEDRRALSGLRQGCRGTKNKEGQKILRM